MGLLWKLLAVAALARGGETLDLRGQFAGPADRQGSIGACHALAAAGLLEAAYFRATGRPIRLSGADLFVRNTALGSGAYEDWVRTGSPSLIEYGVLTDDAAFALRWGVAEVPAYEDFASRYARYRKARLARLAEAVSTPPAGSGSPEERAREARRAWAAAADSLEARRRDREELEGPNAPVTASRMAVRRALAGARLEARAYPGLPPERFHLPAPDCARVSRDRRDFLVAELRAGRPVAASMILSGLPGWGYAETTTYANHSFLIVGLAVDASGAAVFRSRNWADEPDVREDELCHVFALVSLRLPRER